MDGKELPLEEIDKLRSTNSRQTITDEAKKRFTVNKPIIIEEKKPVKKMNFFSGFSSIFNKKKPDDIDVKKSPSDSRSKSTSRSNQTLKT